MKEIFWGSGVLIRNIFVLFSLQRQRLISCIFRRNFYTFHLERLNIRSHKNSIQVKTGITYCLACAYRAFEQFKHNLR